MRRDGGFTLIEIMISLAIVSIALVTLVAAFDNSILSAAHSRSLTDAVMLAEEKISLVGLERFPEQGSSKWDTDTRYPGYRYKTTVMETPFKGARQVSVKVQKDGVDMFTLENYVMENR